MQLCTIYYLGHMPEFWKLPFYSYHKKPALGLKDKVMSGSVLCNVTCGHTKCPKSKSKKLLSCCYVLFNYFVGNK